METTPHSDSLLHQHILRQRATLFNMLLDPMLRVANRCANVITHREELDELLQQSMSKVSYVTYLYVLDLNSVQISANASAEGLMPSDFGRDRSQRPYMQQLVDDKDMILSEAYISMRADRPSITAIQKIYRDEVLIGYLCADFDLRGLPITKDLYSQTSRWRQIKGDPSIRSHVFEQTRIQSRMDEQMDLINSVVDELVSENGVFHIKLHFSSSRATLWLTDDPYRYQIMEFDDLVDPDICLAFPHKPYPKDAVVPQSSIRPIMDTFRHLRFSDDTIYLRAGSINIFNGIVGLNFSCDGSHYIPYEQFIARDSEFWDGMM